MAANSNKLSHQAAYSAPPPADWQLVERDRQIQHLQDDLSNLIDSINSPTVLLGRDLQVRRFSPSAQSFFRLTPDDVGRPIGDLKLRINVANLESLIHRAIEQVELQQQEVDDEDGRWHQLIVRPYKTLDGRIDGAIITANQKIAEETLRRRDEELQFKAAQLEAANKELAAFSYSISHDLRAPLRGVDSFSRIIVEEYGAKLDDEGRRLLGVVRGEAQRMGRLIDDLLSFSRMGRAQMQASELDLAPLAENVFECLDETARRHVQQFQVLPLPLAIGDPAMMRQVLVNLIGNAVKFSRHQPAASIEVGGSSAPDFNTYYVKDNGTGFDQRFANKLFGVFQRLHSEEEFEGSGAGLAIVQRIIHRHGGKVWAEGELNQGATFYFTLPCRKENEHVASTRR